MQVAPKGKMQNDLPAGEDLVMIVEVATLCWLTPGELISRVVVEFCRRTIFVGDKAAVRVDLHWSPGPVVSPVEPGDSCWSGEGLSVSSGSSKTGWGSAVFSDGDRLVQTPAGEPDVQRGLLAVTDDSEDVVASLSGSCCGRTSPDLTSLVALMRWIGGMVSRRNTAALTRWSHTQTDTHGLFAKTFIQYNTVLVQWLGVGLVIERSLVRLPARALSSHPGQFSLPSLRGR